MRTAMYPRIALSNIKKNARIYIPYLLTCIFTVSMFSIMKSLSVNDDVASISSSVSEVLGFGNGVMAVFSFIFLFYTNSFLMKKRKKEFGLFNILGMEKKHISLINAYENLFCAAVGIGGGLGISFLLEKFMYMLLAKIIGVSTVPKYHFSPEALKITVLFFIVLFICIYINSVRIIYRTKTIELLKSDHSGEREPKARWIIAAAGLICLGTGYWLALSVENAVAAITMFFAAVLFVIAGTYMLFTAGSIALLKILKKNKGYYYKTSRFISVSGMIYRMKQNAAGLSNICILSTMVLVVISTTVSLLFGVDSVVRNKCSDDFVINADYSIENLEETIREFAEEEDVEIKKLQKYNSLTFSGIREENSIRVIFDESYDDFSKICIISAFAAEDYRRMTGFDVSPAENEVYAFCNRREITGSSLSIGDMEFSIKGEIKEIIRNGAAETNIAETIYLVVSDDTVLKKLCDIQKNAYGDNASDIHTCINFSTDASEERQLALYDRLLEFDTSQDKYMLTDNLIATRRDANQMTGGLFFIGIFLGLMFASATVIIIYYKQISEGMDDRDRFEILQKVGMNRSEIKKSINSQVLTVFFLPLCVAGIHIIFAFPMVRKILLALGLTDTPLFIRCTILCFAVFAVLYAVVYAMTSRTYYRIVSE
ncbi:MAG: ABC transporter permease [Oscillospiraceae bacterium]